MKKVLFCLILMTFLVAGCDKKVNLTMSNNIDYVAKKIDDECHMLKVSSDGIKDVHLFKNVSGSECYRVKVAGFSENKTYFAMKDNLYYFDNNTGEETKWIDSIAKYMMKDLTKQQLKNYEEGDFYIGDAVVLEDKLYFQFDTSDLYYLPLNAISANEIQKFYDIAGISVLSFIEDQAINYTDSKFYFKGRSDADYKTIGIYEYDIKDNSFTELVLADKKEYNLFNTIKYGNDNIIFTATSNKGKRLYVFDLDTNDVTEISSIDELYFNLENYDYDSVIYEYNGKLISYNYEVSQKTELSETINFKNSSILASDYSYLHYKNGIYYRDYNDDIIYNNKLMNKNDLIDTFMIKDKNGKEKEIPLIEILKDE